LRTDAPMPQMEDRAPPVFIVSLILARGATVHKPVNNGNDEAPKADKESRRFPDPSNKNGNEKRTCSIAHSASQIQRDLAARLGAADQQVAGSRWFEWLWLVADGAGNQPAFAGMTDPCPARPPHRDITCLGQFEQALVRRIPGNDEATARE
jgi:hypothetical protein